jgi:hypothetical protein
MPGRRSATHCVNGHEYTDKNVYWYTGKDGRVRRCCVACQRAREIKQKQKRQSTLGYRYPIYE